VGASGERLAIRVVAAEDNYLIREGMRLLFAAQDDLDLVASVASMSALQAAVEEHEPDVVVTDVRMPPSNGDEGIRTAESLATSHPHIGVVVLSHYVEADWALRLFDRGAKGRAYLLKERVGDLEQLRRAIEGVHRGETVLDPLVVDALVGARRRRQDSLLARLTQREMEVLGLVATGLTNAAIATTLVLSERAVEKHVTSILQKLDLDPDDAEFHRRVRAVLVYLSETSS
jgi:DNA-binding NarL/FixJ family response regulator